MAAAAMAVAIAEATGTTVVAVVHVAVDEITTTLLKICYYAPQANLDEQNNYKNQGQEPSNSKFFS